VFYRLSLQKVDKKCGHVAKSPQAGEEVKNWFNIPHVKLKT
jgi:hypothetical protein